MYRSLPLNALVPNPENPNRISRSFAKKLRHNIEHVRMYETLTVRPHPSAEGKYEVLNGHARLDVLHEMGAERAKCDVWHVSDTQARLFLAVLNRLRGSDVPELRMELLAKLLSDHARHELAAHIPETEPSLRKFEALSREAEEEEREPSEQVTAAVILEFYLTSERHKLVTLVLDEICQAFGLSDSSQALVKLVELYTQQMG